MPTLAPRYMHRFQCIGPDCEDDCCGTWETLVDRASYERLAELAGDHIDTWYALLPQAERTDDHWARTLRRGGVCPALDDGLCAVHKLHGEGALGDVCATYPRRLHRVHDRLEMTGHASCPEVVRLMLAEDAMELEPFGVGLLPRDTAEPIVCGDDLRGYAGALLGVQAPLATRLWFVNELCRRAADGEDLTELWADLSRPDVLVRLHEQLGADTTPLGSAMSLVNRALFERTAPGRIIGPFVAALDGARQTLPSQLLPTQLATYRSRCVELAPLLVEVDRVLTTLARDWWFGRPYTRSGGALLHHRELLLRVAALRWLLVLQPAARSGMAASELHAMLVRVIYAFSRAYDHGEGFLHRYVHGRDGNVADPVALCRFIDGNSPSAG